MNFTTMSYFIALAEEKSFSRAADRLAVTQQTLSAHIANTEAELGIKLINRKVPLSLTYAGQIFLDHAIKLQADERSMLQEMRDIADDERGLLAVGIAATRGKAYMPHLLPLFSKAHPGINYQIVEEENDKLIDLVASGRVDMSLATLSSKRKGLVVKPLYKEQIVLAVSKALLQESYGSEAADRVAEVEKTGKIEPLADLPFLMLGAQDEPGTLARRIVSEAKEPVRIIAQSTNSETLLRLAAKGMGAFFAADYVFAMFGRRSPDMDPISIDLGKNAQIDIQAIWRDSSHVWSVVEAFYDLLVEELGEGSDLRDYRKLALEIA